MKLRLVAGMLIVPLFLGACAERRSSAASRAAPTASSSDSPGITARGTGRVSGSPDTVTVTIGVENSAAKAVEALARNAERARAVIDALKGAGVEAKDIQTAQLSLWPDYAPNQQAITGYRVSDAVSAKLRDLAKAGAVIDGAVAAAGNTGRLQGVYFSIDDGGALKSQARKDAVAKARQQAEQMASAAGVKLGALRSIREVTQNQPYYGFQNTAGAAEGGRAASPTPIEPGTQELTVEVEATWDAT